MKMMKMESLTKRFWRNASSAVDDFNLKVNDGNVLGLIGVNGAGKTTIIRMCSGVLNPTKGLVKIDGLSIGNKKIDASRRLGWVPEFPNFEPSARPLDLMAYFGGIYGMKREKSIELGSSLLKLVGLQKDQDKRIKVFSQGMKKRFAIAVAMLNDPVNYLFDETFNGLDPEGIRMLRRVILELKKRGRAILFSSHILSEVENIADQVAIIHNGKKVEEFDKSKLDSLKKSGENLEDYFFSVIEQYSDD